MPIGIWNVQWLNQNSQRSYPLTDWATGLDKTGTIAIPDDFILALYFPTHAGVDVQPERFYIKQLGIYPTGYNIAIGYNDEDALPVVAVANIDRSTHTENRSYALPGSDSFDDSVGKIVIGSLTAIDQLPPGVYQFDPQGSALEVDAIRPMIRGISSITVVNGQDRSPRIYGDVEFIAGNNMRIVANQVESVAPEIVFNAIEGEGLNEECVCEEEGEGPCIRFINGIPPLPDGNFRMVGDECIDVGPIPNGLQLSDQCSQPCCGCEELEALTRQIDRFSDGVLTLQNFASSLGSEVTQMSQIVLGSRLSDQGCLEC